MPKRVLIAAALLAGVLALVAVAQDGAGISAKYKALKYVPPASTAGTWAVLDRDGANRQVEPYLSSLGGGEAGTGVIVSPPFDLTADTLTFTICGHDGQDGGRQKNFIALLDADSGETLNRTMAPGSDPMQERSWNVGGLKGRKVRIEVRDGIAAGAFAWLGIGRIDAGPPLSIDFRQGMPKDWKAETLPSQPRSELVPGGIPFMRYAATYTMIPANGAAEIPCGFAAQRLFLLGGTVAGGKPLEIYGRIEIVYREGPVERYPLMYGFTLDGDGKLLSRCKAIHLHPSGDPFQHYLVLKPRSGVIEKIRLSRNPKHDLTPRITAITCETAASGKNLQSLPDTKLAEEEQAWIESHAISPGSMKLQEIAAEIRRSHKMPKP